LRGGGSRYPAERRSAGALRRVPPWMFPPSGRRPRTSSPYVRIDGTRSRAACNSSGFAPTPTTGCAASTSPANGHRPPTHDPTKSTWAGRCLRPICLRTMASRRKPPGHHGCRSGSVGPDRVALLSWGGPGRERPQTATIRSACAAADSLAKSNRDLGEESTQPAVPDRIDRRLRRTRSARAAVGPAPDDGDGDPAALHRPGVSGGAARPSVPFDQAGCLPLDRPAPQATVKWRRLLRRGLHRRRRVPSFPALGDEGLEVPVATAAHHPEASGR